MTEQTRSRILIALRWALAGIIIALGIIPKVTNDPTMVENFRRWGYPPHFHYIVAAGEILAVTMLLIPRTVVLGAGLIVVLMLGAAGTHLTHGEFAMALVPLSFLVTAVYIGLGKVAARRYR